VGVSNRKQIGHARERRPRHDLARSVVNRVRPGVIKLRRQALRKTPPQRYLERVIAGGRGRVARGKCGEHARPEGICRIGYAGRRIDIRWTEGRGETTPEVRLYGSHQVGRVRSYVGY